MGLSRCARGVQDVCLQGFLRLGPAAAQGEVNWSGEGVGYSGMNGLCRAETASVGTIFCWIGGTQIANKLKIWSSLRFKATDGELAPDWIASETLGISTMRSAGW